MDDPCGCLRGVELAEHNLYKLTSEMVEKKLNELPRINHCPSCEVHLVNVMKEFCLECLEYHRVFEYDDDDQFQEVSPGRSAPSAHLKNFLRKWKIYEIFSFNQISFLGNVIVQFQAKSGKSMNYSCFLHNYLETVPSEVWPCKKKLWNLFLIAALNPLQPGDAQNRSLMNGAALLLFETQPQLFFFN